VATVNDEVGALAVHAQDHAEVAQSLQAALVAFSAVLGPGHGNTVSIRANLANLANTAILNGRSAEGLAELDAVLPWFVERKHPTDGIQFYRAQALNDLKRGAEAQAALVPISEERLTWLHWSAKENRWRWVLMGERGRALQLTGEAAEGRKLLRVAAQGLQADGDDPSLVNRYKGFLKN
jgi:hypothetical protein